MISYIIRRLLLLHPDGLPCALVPVRPVLPAPRRHGDAARRRRRPQRDPGVVARASERYGLNDPLIVQFVDYWKRRPAGISANRSSTIAASTSILRRRRRAASASPSGPVDRDRRRHHGRADLVRQALLDHRQGDDVPHRCRVGAPGVRARVHAAVRFAVYPNKHDWPEWVQLRTSRHRARHVGRLRHPDRRPVALPDPPGDHVGVRWRGDLAARMTRGSMLDVLAWTTCAPPARRACRSVPSSRRHGLRNALIPVITIIGIDFGTVIGAAVLTETVFSWPGHRVADRRLGERIATSR